MICAGGTTDARGNTTSYDVNGQRVKKTAGGDTVSFYYDDNGRLIKQEDDGGNIWFYYNPTGAAASMSYHGTHYYFLKNLQGDVVALVNMQGDIAARYVYDAWGDIVSVTDENGNAITDQNHVANQNPIRYRGYYYDTESGLYYLNSRYYDPVTGRFVNAGGYVSTGQDITGFNMFAYCGNNPVMYKDDSGESFSAAIGFGILLVGMLLTLSASDSDTIQNQEQSPNIALYSEHHKKGTVTPSNRNSHEEGESRRRRDQGGEKGDARRKSRSNKRRPNQEVTEGSSTNWEKKVVAGGTAIIGTIAIVYLIGNDITGVGVADDGAIAPIGKIVWDCATIVFS